MSTEKATASALARTQIVDGWTFGFTGDEHQQEPLVRDLELGRRLGYTRPVAIRKLIRGLLRAGELSRVVISAAETTSKGGRPATEYWLSEADARFVVAKSETKIANQALRGMIAALMAYQRGQLAAATPAPPLDATMVNSARVRDDRASMAELRLGVRRVRLARGYSVQRIYGYLRRSQQISSPFAIALPLLDRVLAGLKAIELGVLSLPSRVDLRTLEAAKRQLDLFDGEPTKH